MSQPPIAFTPARASTKTQLKPLPFATSNAKKAPSVSGSLDQVQLARAATQKLRQQAQLSPSLTSSPKEASPAQAGKTSLPTSPPEILQRAGESASAPDRIDPIEERARNAGITIHQFRDTQPHDDIPPGSHYPAWMWDALDKDGFITVELHVDGAVINSALNHHPVSRSSVRQAWQGESAQDKKEREELGIKAPRVGDIHPLPDPKERYHTLMQIPVPEKSAPWGRAKRVLLIPQSYELSRTIDDGRERWEYERAAKRSGKEGPQKLQQPIAEWATSPPTAKRWLANNTHHGVLLGACAITASELDRTPENYWVVLSKNDTLDYVRIALSDEDTFSSKALSRWMGEVRSEGLHHAMVQAANKAGAIAPDDWSEDDKAWWAKENATHEAAQLTQALAPPVDDPDAILPFKPFSLKMR